MARQSRLEMMFSGHAPTLKRLQGMKDARARKPKLSRDPDYLKGYTLEKRVNADA